MGTEIKVTSEAYGRYVNTLKTKRESLVTRLGDLEKATNNLVNVYQSEGGSKISKSLETALHRRQNELQGAINNIKIREEQADKYLEDLDSKEKDNSGFLKELAEISINALVSFFK